MRIEKQKFIAALTEYCYEHREHSFAFWKLETLARNGETCFLPENDCYYAVYENFMFCCFSNDGRCSIPKLELNNYSCISMTGKMFESVKSDINDFNVNYGYKLHYDFTREIKPNKQHKYSIVPFDFKNEQHYIQASVMINQENGDWIMPDNLRKMMREPVFDPSLWMFVKDNEKDELIGIAISTYDERIKETDIEWFYILPSFHGKGAGRFLLSEIICRSRQSSDDIRVGGTNEFYKKCGFVERESNIWACKDGFSFVAPCIQANILP